ncbi:L-threonylcarbamoyladenylate synthase [Bacteroides heparinolyticus]|uniref:L-threonylcarbamoyladenylate synthase n=1 Tax=Prevotella heparinolytica TaxID=28113 RepID=UPI00359FE01C
MNRVETIIKTLFAGNVVLIPTDTVYGLAALPTEKKAIDKIYALKGRPTGMNLPIMVSEVRDLKTLGLDVNDNAAKLFDSTLVPGAITFILGFKTIGIRPSWLERREEVAVRIPNNSLLLSVLKRTGPLLVTSANKHGSFHSPNKVSEILKELNGKPDLIIEDEEGKEIPSTIINCRHTPPLIERSGLIPIETINEILGYE